MSDLLIGSLFGNIGSEDNFVLPFDGTQAGTVAIQLRSNSFAGAGLILKSRVGPTAPWLPCPYTKVNVNGAFSDGTVGGAVVTNDGIIQIVIADGMQLALDASAGGWASGSMDVWVRLAARA